MGIRVGVSIDQLSPFLQSLRCPENDLTDPAQVDSLISEIHGASTKPELGSVPSFVRPSTARIGRWSDSAIAVAEYLVRNTKNGVDHELQTSPAKISEATGLPEQDVRFGVLELNDANLIDESNEIGSVAFWAKPALFAEFDSHFLDFVTSDDAIAIAHRLVNDNVRQIQIKELATQFPDWKPRRINSALSYLVGKRLVQPTYAIGSAPYTMVCVCVTEYTRRFCRENS
jgi:hypothetical protein